MPYSLTRGDTRNVLLPLSLRGVPYTIISGSAFLLTVKANTTDADSAAICQKTLGMGLATIYPSSLQATFYPIDFYAQASTQFYFDVQVQESGTLNVETVCLDTITLTTDITRLTGASVTIYTGNPPYPSGAPYPS